ncbi:stage II sporulation protein R [Paenibacillus sp. M1]|uniref:Stage II sporulation protein R n=1 Tax=Paenibacillus haidiansis TaxID=1574488 RepID=A0ABU7VXJ3_9BACL
MKRGALIFFSMMILLMSWEGQKIDSAAAEGLIPQESIRLRILANSDRTGDQVVKRRVRDAVVEQMNGWVAELDNPQSLEAAREVIREHMVEIERQVGRTLADSGKSYSYKVELGVVPFPTKMYGGAVYPAGDYEALRVTLGEGKGKNWWCVLFPPLCFVDAGSGEALQSKASAANQKADKADSGLKTAGQQAHAEDAGEAQVQQDEPEVRFFIWDVLVRLWNWITGLFA